MARRRCLRPWPTRSTRPRTSTGRASHRGGWRWPACCRRAHVDRGMAPHAPGRRLWPGELQHSLTIMPTGRASLVACPSGPAWKPLLPRRPARGGPRISRRWGTCHADLRLASSIDVSCVPVVLGPVVRPIGRQLIYRKQGRLEWGTGADLLVASLLATGMERWCQ